MVIVINLMIWVTLSYTMAREEVELKLCMKCDHPVGLKLEFSVQAQYKRNIPGLETEEELPVSALFDMSLGFVREHLTMGHRRVCICNSRCILPEFILELRSELSLQNLIFFNPRLTYLALHKNIKPYSCSF